MNSKWQPVLSAGIREIDNHKTSIWIAKRWSIDTDLQLITLSIKDCLLLWSTGLRVLHIKFPILKSYYTECSLLTLRKPDVLVEEKV